MQRTTSLRLTGAVERAGSEMSLAFGYEFYATVTMGEGCWAWAKLGAREL